MAAEVIGVVNDLVEADELDLALACAWNNWPFCGEGAGPRPGGCINPWLKGDFEDESNRLDPYEKDDFLNLIWPLKAKDGLPRT
jgi:hypothetical protein